MKRRPTVAIIEWVYVGIPQPQEGLKEHAGDDGPMVWFDGEPHPVDSSLPILQRKPDASISVRIRVLPD